MAPPGAAEALKTIRRTGIIAILRGQFERRQLLSIASALREGGIRAIEVTMNSPQALEHVRSLSAELGNGVMVGVGTVRDTEEAKLALDAGADFLVAPNLDPGTLSLARERDVLHLPGVLTPTEVQRAVALGALAVKLFPASTFGPDYLRSIRAPLNDVSFIPVGGIDEKNVGEYARAGASAVGAGSLLADPGLSPNELAERARKFTNAWVDAATTQ